MKIWFTDYQLFPKGMDLEKDGDLLRSGAILRVEFPDGKIGYGDLCPHPRFGDAPITIQLRNLTLGQLTPILKQSLYCAQVDAEARSKGQSLFSEIPIKSHFLISNLLEFDLNRIRNLQGQGFSEFKIKVGSELILETEMLKSFVERMASGVKLRLDFNSKLTEKNFVAWLDQNCSWLKDRLDFIEDPFQYEPKAWTSIMKKFGVTLAVDFGLEAQNYKVPEGIIVVIKPAVQSFAEILEKVKSDSVKFVFTHYLDFPLGQMFALAEAQKCKNLIGARVLTCGLQHQEFYESFQFQDLIGTNGAYVIPPSGTGIGFDEALEKQDWHALK